MKRTLLLRSRDRSRGGLLSYFVLRTSYFTPPRLDNPRANRYTLNMTDTPAPDEPQAAQHEQALQAALRAYEDARIDGLCEDGAWERAAEVLRALGGLEALDGIEWPPFVAEQPIAITIDRGD